MDALPIIFLSVAGMLLLFVIIRIYRSRKPQDLSRRIVKETMRREQAERRELFLASFFQVLCRIPLAGSYIRMAEKMYGMISPYNTAFLARAVSITAVIALGWSCLGVIALFAMSFLVSGRITLYCVFSSVFLVYVIGKEVLHKRVATKEYRLLEDLAKFVAAVKHRYVHEKNIPNAILDAAVGLNYEVQLHALRIHEVLSAAKRRERVREYVMSSKHNKYLKQLMVQAYTASERGELLDKNSDSIFARNMEVLRLDILKDIERKKRKEYLLQGYTFVICFPVLFMDVLKKWGKDFSTGMSDFYDGPGKFVVALALFAAFLMYDLINKAKEINSQWFRFGNRLLDYTTSRDSVRRLLSRLDDNTGRFFKKIRRMLVGTGDNTSLGKFFCKMFLYGVTFWAVGLAFIGVLHKQDKDRILHDGENVKMVVTTASEVQREAIVETVLDMTYEYRYTDDLTLERVQRQFSKRLPLNNATLTKAASEEIMRRVEEYQNAYLHWYEFLLAMVFGLLCSCIPIVSLSYKYRLVLAGRDDEVRQFQSIILMERSFPDVTTVSLLEEMELFAVMFKSSIRECLNNYSSGPQKALEQLKKNESEHTWFCEIVDGFLDADSVGIKAAFDETGNNRDVFEKTKELEEDIRMERKKDITELLACIPMGIVIGVYFVVPFIADALSGVGELFSSMETLQNITR